MEKWTRLCVHNVLFLIPGKRLSVICDSNSEPRRRDVKVKIQLEDRNDVCQYHKRIRYKRKIIAVLTIMLFSLSFMTNSLWKSVFKLQEIHKIYESVITYSKVRVKNYIPLHVWRIKFLKVSALF